MRGWGSRTPKRTTIWSNSSAVRFFCTSRKARKYWLGSGTKLVDVYYNSRGERKFKGNQNLRKSQWIGIWLIYYVPIWSKMSHIMFPFMTQTTAHSSHPFWTKGIPSSFWSSLCRNDEQIQEGEISTIENGWCSLSSYGFCGPISCQFMITDL